MIRKQWLDQHEQSSLHCLAQAQSMDDSVEAIVNGKKVGLVIIIIHDDNTTWQVEIGWVSFVKKYDDNDNWQWWMRMVLIWVRVPDHWRAAIHSLTDRCLLSRLSVGWSPRPLLETMGLKKVHTHFGWTCAGVYCLGGTRIPFMS